MTPDPFAPPTAPSDHADGSWPPRPPAVNLACRLVIASLALGIVSLLPGVRPPRPDDPVVPLAYTLGAVLVFGGLTIWLAIEVLRGKPWARWAMLAYLALGWWLGGGELDDDFMRSPVLGVIDVACIALEAVACGLLFSGAGARWFAALDARRRRQRSGT
jgi:hypothetical protein